MMQPLSSILTRAAAFKGCSIHAVDPAALTVTLCIVPDYTEDEDGLLVQYIGDTASLVAMLDSVDGLRFYDAFGEEVAGDGYTETWSFAVDPERLAFDVAEVMAPALKAGEAGLDW